MIYFKVFYLLAFVYLGILCGREAFSTHSGTSIFCFTMMVFVTVWGLLDLRKSK